MLAGARRSSAALLDLPFDNSKLDFLDRWLEPCSAASPEIRASSFGAGLVALDASRSSSASSASSSASRVYRNGLDADGDRPDVERLGGFAGVLGNAYYFDVGARPLRRAVRSPRSRGSSATASTATVIDGAVNGIGARVRAAPAAGCARLQTGLVRNYALAIVLGTVLLLVYVATRVTL